MTKVVDLPLKTPKLDDVVGWERAVYSLSGGAGPRYNPDALVRTQGLPIYAKMRDDEQVKAVMQFRRDAVMGRGWFLQYEKGSTLSEVEQKKRISVMTQLLTKRMRGSFEDGLYAVDLGRYYGFSLTEKVYTKVEIEARTYVGLRLMVGRDPCSFDFHTDDYGLLKKCVQRVNGREQDINLSKFVHYVHNPEFDPYFGRSELREAYRPWYIKQRIDDYQALYLERFAGGFLILQQDAQSQLTPNSPTTLALQTVLENLHGASGIILPKGVTATMEFPPSGNTGFKEALEAKDLAIAKAVLMPNLLGLSHTGQTGAYAQSQTQLEAFTWTLNADGNRMATTVKQQVIDDLGRQNWDDDEYPHFKWKPASIEWIKWICEMWIKLVSANSIVVTEKDEQRLRAILDFDPREEGDKPLVTPQQEAEQEARRQDGERAQAAQDLDGDLRKREANRADRQQQIDRENVTKDRQLRRASIKRRGLANGFRRNDGRRNGGDAGSPVLTDGRSVVPHGTLHSCGHAQFSYAVQRVAFSVIERKQEDMSGRLIDEAARLVAKGVKRVLGTDEQLMVLTDQDVEDIQSASLSSAEVGKLNATMQRGLREAWDLGLEHSRNEVDRARGFRRATFANLRDKAAAYFETRAFRMAGDLSDRVRNMIQQELMNSVKYGRSPTQTREAIWGRLVDQGLTTRTWVRQTETDEDVMRALNEIWADDEAGATRYLDTLARTNQFEAMNEARYAEFTDPELDGFVVALEYSSILDDRTTDICEGLDDVTFRADSQLWDKYRPPNHFNCRAILVPITAIDGWDGIESDLPNVEPQEGFGGEP